jgi:photosystem II stability/assembly factor-like uncharacterized protein
MGARRSRLIYLVKIALFLGAAFWLVRTPAARAADQGYVVLQEPALQVRDPAAALLISITRAGNRLVAVGNHGVITYSDDNGASWRQSAVPLQVTITTVAFASAKVGWAAGAYGVVLHTTDAGATWQLQIWGKQVNQLMQQAAARLFQSNAQDPAAARAVRRASIFAAAGPDKPFLTILPLSPEQAIIMGGYRMCIRTADAGRNWADCSLSIPDPVSHNVYSAIRAGNVIYAAGEAGDVFSADAGGLVFKPLNSPGPATLLGILQTRSGALLAYGVADSMFRSTDGGNGWTSINVPGGADLTSGLVMDTGVIIVTSPNGEICASSDDGQRFHVLPLNLGMAVFGATQAGNGALVFVGSGGVRVVSKIALNGSN